MKNNKNTNRYWKTFWVYDGFDMMDLVICGLVTLITAGFTFWLTHFELHLGDVAEVYITAGIGLLTFSILRINAQLSNIIQYLKEKEINEMI